VLFSPERIRQFVIQKLAERQPKVDLAFAGARLLLSMRGWPAVAIELSQLEVKPRNECLADSFVLADRLQIPLKLSDFFQGKLSFGHIQAGTVRIHYRPQACPKETASLQKYFATRWSQEVINTTRFLDEFTMQKIEVTQDDKSLPPLWVENLHVMFDAKNKKATVDADLRLQEPLIGQANLQPLQLEATVFSHELQLQVRGSLNEGQIRGKLRWAIDRGEVEAEITNRDLPLSQVFRIIKRHGTFNELSPDFKNQWLTCDMTTRGPASDFKNLLWQMHQCRLYGTLGEMRILNSEISLSQPDLKISLINLSVKKWLQGFGWAKNWGRISEFGRFNGDMKIALADQNVEMKGAVTGAEVYLASLQDRVRQKIEQIQVSLAYLDQRISGRADAFRLNDGEVEGYLTFNVSKEGTGILQLALANVALAFNTQRVLWGGRAPAVALFGQVLLESGELAFFEGDYAMKEWQTLNWELHNLKSKVSYEDRNWTFLPQAERFVIRPESKWLPMINTIIAGAKDKPSPIVFAPLTIKIDIDNHGAVQWADLSANLYQTKYKINSVGEWSSRLGLSGFIATPEQRFTLSGSLQVPVAAEAR